MIARPMAIDPARAEVHAQLRDEIAAQPPGGVVDRGGGAVQVARAEQTDQTVAQIFALQQDEDRDDQHDEGGLDRRNRRRQRALRELHRRERRLVHFDRGRHGGRIARRASGEARRARLARRDALQRGGGAAHQRIGPADGFLLHRLDLLLDRHLILGQVACELHQLRPDQRRRRPARWRGRTTRR